MKSALFVDFDNIYSSLRRLNVDYAERFAQQPIDWIEWLARELELPEHCPPDSSRRLLVRRVYLNPQPYQRFRPAFNRAGFEIVDCPPMTSEGKTSTDIHMVLDVMELLAHETRYDEFIVFSADADFTPVLRKLRRWDRRTTVLAIGFPSAAYQASADLLINQEQFIAEALGFADALATSVPTRPVVAVEKDAAAALAGQSTKAAAVDVTTLKQQILDFIRDRVAQSPTPVALPWFATALPANFEGLRDKNWLGEGGFRKFIESLPLQPLRLQWTGGGLVSDPARHRTEAALKRLWGRDAELLAVAKPIHDAIGAPLLTPAQMRFFFDALAADVRSTRFDLSETGKRVRDRCKDKGEPVSRADVSWLLKGLLMSGFDFQQKAAGAESFAMALMENLLMLARREQLIVDDQFEAQVGRWLGLSTSNHDGG